MTDQFAREINYMRLSLTDRCNLRCTYCMPNGITLAAHAQMLTYEELLRVCEAAVSLGINRFKLTGGEPLVRRGCTAFIASLKALPGVQQVTLTTNGVLLAQHLDALCRAGIDAVNISIDTVDDARYTALTGVPAGTVQSVLQAADVCISCGIPTKLNAVLLEETFAELPQLVGFVQQRAADVRLIELMPIGQGKAVRGVPMQRALDLLRQTWPDLRQAHEKRGNGPAVYYKSDFLQGRVGCIAAVSNSFCATCNRVRLTAAGTLKPCLCYADGISLRALLRGGASQATLREAMRACIQNKPDAHSFLSPADISERQSMHTIGG